MNEDDRLADRASDERAELEDRATEERSSLEGRASEERAALVERATAALADSDAQGDVVVDMLLADRHERRQSDHRVLLALLVALLLIAVNLIALFSVLGVVSRVRSVQRDGVERAVATKANTEELKRIAKDTNLTSAQLSCIFSVAAENPGLSQTDPPQNLRLINECVAARVARGP